SPTAPRANMRVLRSTSSVSHCRIHSGFTSVLDSWSFRIVESVFPAQRRQGIELTLRRFQETTGTGGDFAHVRQQRRTGGPAQKRLSVGGRNRKEQFKIFAVGQGVFERGF